MKKMLCVLLIASMLFLGACGGGAPSSAPAGGIGVPSQSSDFTNENADGGSNIYGADIPTFSNEPQTVDISGSWNFPVLGFGKELGADAADYLALDVLEFAEGLGYIIRNRYNEFLSIMNDNEENPYGIHLDDFHGKDDFGRDIPDPGWTLSVTCGVEANLRDGLFGSAHYTNFKSINHINALNSDEFYRDNDAGTWVFSDRLKYNLLHYLQEAAENETGHTIRWLQYDATNMLTDELKNLLETRGYRAYVAGRVTEHLFDISRGSREWQISFFSDDPNAPVYVIYCDSYSDTERDILASRELQEEMDLTLALRLYKGEPKGIPELVDVQGLDGQCFVLNGRLMMTDNYMDFLEATIV